MHVAEWVFWASAVAIAFTYFGYSILVVALASVRRNPPKRAAIEPRVTVLITAYNERQAIARKIEQTLALDYPADKLELIVASDGSTDGTDDIVRSFSARGVKLVRVEGRVGKTETQNQAVKLASGDVIVFSDATTIYERSAIRNLVRNYADPAVGAVSGRYEYVDPKGTPIGAGSVLFWRYENLIKSAQTDIKTITGCCGCIYSVRRDLYVPLPADIISDLCQPLKIIENGHRVVFEKDAVAYEETTTKVAEEFSMRVRVMVRGMRGMLFMKKLFNPFNFGFVSFQLFSHKVLRWMVPVFLALMLVSSALLVNRVPYGLLLAAQLVFYAMALTGYVAERFGRRFKVLSIPVFFVTVNLASVVAMIRVYKGQRAVTWETVRN